jgi:hypothetical protein
MDISANLAAALALLTEDLDDDHARLDIAASLNQVAADAAAAVSSYVGLTVTQRDSTLPFTLTAMEDGADPEAVRSSLLFPLPADGGLPLDLILYAASPGAFVDLAADLSWVLGRPLTDFVIDDHLRPPPEPDTAQSLHTMSVINQAIGVLIGRGYDLEAAQRELDARAAGDGHTRYEAARVILQSLSARSKDD